MVQDDSFLHGRRGQREQVRLLHKDPSEVEGQRLQADLQRVGRLHLVLLHPQHFLPNSLVSGGTRNVPAMVREHQGLLLHPDEFDSDDIRIRILRFAHCQAMVGSGRNLD